MYTYFWLTDGCLGMRERAILILIWAPLAYTHLICKGLRFAVGQKGPVKYITRDYGGVYFVFLGALARFRWPRYISRGRKKRRRRSSFQRHNFLSSPSTSKQATLLGKTTKRAKMEMKRHGGERSHQGPNSSQLLSI
jgi:hypothetical protein